MAKMNIKSIFYSIQSIEVDGTIETDTKAIYEFVEGYDVEMFRAVKAHIDKQYNNWLLPEETVKCESCGAENKLRITVDQTDFFVRG